jgi:hypothetical protein
VFYEFVDGPLKTVKLSTTVTASSLSEDRLFEAIYNVITAMIVATEEVGIALE